MQLFPTTARLLKAKQSLFADILHRQFRWAWAAELIVVGVVGSALYGMAVTLDAASWHSLWDFSWKAVTLLWLPLAVCAPSLAVFAAVRGSAVSVRELLLLMLTCAATVGLVLFSVAPILAFFQWTGGLPDEVNLIMFVGSLFLGIIVLGQALIAGHEDRKATHPSSAPAVDILVVWGVLLVVVLFRMMRWLGWM